MMLADPTFDTRISSGRNSDAGFIVCVRDPKIVRRKAKPNENGDEDGMLEEMVDEGVLDKRLILFESELSAVFAHMGRKDNALTELLCRAWDGDVLKSLTKNPTTATGAHISIVGHTTPAKPAGQADLHRHAERVRQSVPVGLLEGVE